MKAYGLLLIVVAAAALALPASAPARSRYCSAGDTCLAVSKRNGVVRLEIGTSPLAGRRYRLCVTAPDRSRKCRRFRLAANEDGTMAGSNVRWDRHFPDKGPGKYLARWALGSGDHFFPALDFRVRP